MIRVDLLQGNRATAEDTHHLENLDHRAKPRRQFLSQDVLAGNQIPFLEGASGRCQIAPLLSTMETNKA
jgi:hypothetical protein